MELDEIIYAAITADQGLMAELAYTKPSGDTGYALASTCIETPPDEMDNSPLPYIVIMEEPSQNDQGTKDTVWESDVDVVNVGVIISATSPKEVKRLRRLLRRAVGSYVESMTENFPYLRQASRDGIAWDWTKPCYYDTLHYQCDMQIDLNENSNE